MKKLVPILTLLLLVGPLARAQRYEKNILGVRSGLNLAYLHAEGNTTGNTSPRVGYHIGVSDQILLFAALPLYLETGVDFSSRGGRFDGLSFRPMYMQIPLTLHYRIGLGRQLALQPFAGAYFGAGIGGKARSESGWSDLFGQQGILRRTDFGVRFGLGLSVKRIWFGVRYDRGCTNLLDGKYAVWRPSPDSRYGYDFDRLTANCFTISVGYDF